MRLCGRDTLLIYDCKRTAIKYIELFFFLMIRRPPRSTLDRSSAASDVYKRQPEDAPGERRVVGLEREEAHVRIGKAVAARQAAAGISAVSYTHLRAHETVLDIVCRLLLEKKKLKNDTRVYTCLIVERIQQHRHHRTLQYCED